jgi:hypothetical protein
MRGALYARATGFLAAALLSWAAFDVPAQTQIDPERLDELLRVKVRTVQHMALNPVLVRATRAQNLERLQLDEIKRRDAEWKSTKALTPFKIALQNSAAGRLLKDTVTRLDSVNEAFVTDNQGANVAAFPATTDYWQGDEAKWSESFRQGDGRVFIGDLELDQSTQTYAVQISAPVIDRGETIGVLVVGVTIGYLEGRGG